MLYDSLCVRLIQRGVPPINTSGTSASTTEMRKSIAVTYTVNPVTAMRSPSLDGIPHHRRYLLWIAFASTGYYHNIPHL